MALGGSDGVELGPVVGGGSSNDLLLLGLPIGIDHWSIGMEASIAVLLHMARLLTEMANNSFGFTIASISIDGSWA